MLNYINTKSILSVHPKDLSLIQLEPLIYMLVSHLMDEEELSIFVSSCVFDKESFINLCLKNNKIVPKINPLSSIPCEYITCTYQENKYIVHTETFYMDIPIFSKALIKTKNYIITIDSFFFKNYDTIFKAKKIAVFNNKRLYNNVNAHPSIISFFLKSEKKTSEIGVYISFHKNGLYHRINAPASIRKNYSLDNKDNLIMIFLSKEYLINNLYHNIKGPTIEMYELKSHFEHKYSCYYKINGKTVLKDEFIEKLSERLSLLEKQNS